MDPERNKIISHNKYNEQIKSPKGIIRLILVAKVSLDQMALVKAMINKIKLFMNK